MQPLIYMLQAGQQRVAHMGRLSLSKRSGEVATDMQLAGSQPVVLSTMKSYIVTLSMQCIGPAWATAAAVLAASGTAEQQTNIAAVQVSFVEDNTGTINSRGNDASQGWLLRLPDLHITTNFTTPQRLRCLSVRLRHNACWHHAVF